MSQSNSAFESSAAAAQPANSPSLINRLFSGEAIIVVACILVYWPALNGGFIFDDDILLTENPLVRSADGLPRIWVGTESGDYWPVTYTMFWFEWRLWGMHPLGYHGVNLLLHIAAALLIWTILEELSIPGAFLAALLFAVHPVNVESVAWIAQRKGLLALVFFLLSILWYLRAQQQSRGEPEESHRSAGFGFWYWCSLLSFVMAMLSKGSVAMLPLVLLLVAWWQSRRIGISDLIRIAPFFAVAGLLTVVNVWFQKHGMMITVRNVGFSERLAGAGSIIWFYLSTAMAPIHLVFIYPQWRVDVHDLIWWLPLMAVAAVTIALWWRRNSREMRWVRAILFAWLFFCLSLVPILGFADIGFMRYSLVADHYQHIALIGVVALGAAGWSTWRTRSARPRPDGEYFATLAVGTLMLLACHQASIYKNPVALYEDTLRKNPSCTLAHFNLAFTLAEQGRLEDAAEHYQQALRLQPDYIQARNNLGSLLVRQGRVQEAIEHFQQVLRIQPDNAVADTNMGIALLAANRTPEALEYLEKAVRLADHDPDAHLNFGIALARSGRLPEAVEQFEQALRLQNYMLSVYANLTSAYVELRRPAEAISVAQRGLDLARAGTGRTGAANRGLAEVLSRRTDSRSRRAAAGAVHSTKL